MKRLHDFRRRLAAALRELDSCGTRSADRNGSTLVVVIALLGALLLLGMLVLTLASQEQVTSEYFADAAKDPQPDFDPDAYFDDVLRQLTIGPNDRERQSALYGGRWSLLANMLGDDITPYNGRGVNVVWDATNLRAAHDLDYDGAPDTTQNDALFTLNDSPAASGALPSLGTYPKPDVGYTYPDINNPFLAYDGMAPTGTATAPGLPFRAILPSFHRPQYLRGIPGLTVDQWYKSALTEKRVFRLHRNHVCIDDKGVATGVRRVFDTAADAFAAGLSNNPFPLETGIQGPWTGDGVTYGTGATVYTGLDVDTDGDGVNDSVLMDLGLQPESVGGGLYRVPLVAVSIRSADSLFNLNTHGNVHGAMANGSLQQNPFGGPRVTSAGADGIVGTGDDTFDTNPNYISKSNTGAMPYEVNPQWGMSGMPMSGAQRLHQLFFGHDPATYQELANMEWWFLQMGAPIYGATAADIDEIVFGRNAGINDNTRLRNAILAATKLPRDFCWPGQDGVDDDRNGREGYSLDPRSRYGSYYPLDFFGAGQYVVRGTAGRTKRQDQFGQMLFRGFDNYGVDQSNLYYVLSTSSAYGGALMRNATLNSPLKSDYLPNGGSGWTMLTDVPTDTKLDPRLGSDVSDSPFSPSEAEFLQLNNADISVAGITSRVEKLAPVNFKLAPNAESIRKLYTPVSWDLKSFGKTYFGPSFAPANNRNWEFKPDPGRGGNLCFPPLVGNSNYLYNGNPQEPFRAALRNLLLIDTQSPAAYRDPQARFSINHIVEIGPDNRLRFRPLTAHSFIPGNAPTLGSGPVRTASQLAQRSLDPYPNNQQIPEYIQSAADQEWLARRDRQLMCRDIYVMLYMLCGGEDGLDYATTLNTNQDVYGYSDSSLETPANPEGLVDPTKANQCKLMAQFAVNLVDQMDGDDVMTAFEYDINLADGWGLGDDPFSTTDDSQPSQRRVVFGVEEQQLAFSEASAIWAKRVNPAPGIPAGMDHQATEWNDTNTKNWLFFELQNVSPRNVDFSGQAWQVAVLPNITGVRNYAVSPVSATLTAEERRLTLTTGSVNSSRTSALQATRPVFSVKTDSEADQDTSNNTRESNFTLNPHHSHASVNPTKVLYPLAPRAEAMEFATMATQTDGQMLDLITGWNQYRVNRGAATNEADGNQVASTASNPASTDLLHIDTAGDPDMITSAHNQQITITLELRRRLNPWRVMPDADPATSTQHGVQSRDNPWVVVDKINVPLNVFAIEMTDTYTQIRPQLNGIQSVERGELLNRKVTIPFVPVPPMYDASQGTAGEDDWMKYVRDSIGQRNFNNTPTTQPTYMSVNQSRFDRQFGSVVELFNVPLYGPEDTTFHLVSQKQPNTPLPAPAVNAADTRNMLAGSMFLSPQPRNPSTGAPITTADYTNRWFRLLEFIETPSRWNWHNNNHNVAAIDVGAPNASPIGQFRKPGFIDLNNIHNPQILAGILDDRDVIPAGNTAGFPYLSDSVETTGNGYYPRDWWFEFLLSRDGRDPLNNNQILPGIPTDYSGAVRLGSRPFLPVETTAHGAGSIEDTVYRGLPRDLDAGTNDTRRLFEIGYRNAMGTRETVDPDVNHRLLGKVVNNTTNRSNTFFVFITIQFYEAAQQNNPMDATAKIYRIGAKRTGDVDKRGFFVVDRTKAVELLRQQHLPKPAPPPTGNGHYSFEQTFNYQSMILHKRIIQ
jgi:hypothetical protein